jgi:hypothetical protein
VDAASPSTGDYLQFNGTDWVNATLEPTVFASANVTTSAALANTPTAINLGTNPSITIPATGDYNIEVFVDGSVCVDASTRSWAVELVQDPAGTPAVVATAIGRIVNSFDQVSLHYFIEGATNDETYTFGLQGAANVANDVWIPASVSACSTIASGLTDGTPNLRVTVKRSP